MAGNLHNLSDEEIYQKYEEQGIYEDPERFIWVKELLVEAYKIKAALKGQISGLMLVLDVGTGGSASLFGLLKRISDCEIITIDLNKTNLTLSKQKLKSEKISPKLFNHVRQDARVLGFISDSFDIVCSTLTAHEISAKSREYEDKALSIFELDRVCSEERYVVIIDTAGDFAGAWKHRQESLDAGQVSFIAGEELGTFMHLIFPNNSISVRDFQALGGTIFFLIVMRKISKQDISEMRDLSAMFETIQKQGNEKLNRMLAEYKRLLKTSKLSRH